jgi:hypothetical protein
MWKGKNLGIRKPTADQDWRPLVRHDAVGTPSRRTVVEDVIEGVIRLATGAGQFISIEVGAEPPGVLRSEGVAHREGE